MVDFLLIVRPTLPTWTKRMRNVATLDMRTDTSNIHRVVFSLFLEGRLISRTVVIFGLRFYTRHLSLTPHSMSTVSSMWCVFQILIPYSTPQSSPQYPILWDVLGFPWVSMLVIALARLMT